MHLATLFHILCVAIMIGIAIRAFFYGSYLMRKARRAEALLRIVSVNPHRDSDPTPLERLAWIVTLNRPEVEQSIKEIGMMYGFDNSHTTDNRVIVSKVERRKLISLKELYRRAIPKVNAMRMKHCITRIRSKKETENLRFNQQAKSVMRDIAKHSRSLRSFIITHIHLSGGTLNGDEDSANH